VIGPAPRLLQGQGYSLSHHGGRHSGFQNHSVIRGCVGQQLARLHHLEPVGVRGQAMLVPTQQLDRGGTGVPERSRCRCSHDQGQKVRRLRVCPCPVGMPQVPLQQL
jgi:hypothetical protein